MFLICFHTFLINIGSVRVVGGFNKKSGRVEVYHSGTWRAVCDDNWDHNDARVICRMLGLRFTIKISFFTLKIIFKSY